MTRVSHLEQLAAEIRRRGVYSVSRESGVRPRLVRDFLRTLDMPVSRWSRLSRAVGMEPGELHLVDLKTGLCSSCGRPDEEHQPVFPKDR
jgi:hypothetical protein